MAMQGQNFTKAEQDAGWPDSLKHGQLAVLQYPFTQDEPEKRRVATSRASDILNACKNGDLPHTATTKTVTPKMPKFPKQPEYKPIGWLFQAEDAYFKGMTAYRNTPPRDVTTYAVTAPAFAAWLTQEGEAQSVHIIAWCEAVGVADLALDAPSHVVASPLKPATVKSIKNRDLITPRIEDAQRDVDDPFDTPSIWLKLRDMAEKRVRPLYGASDTGIQWTDSNDEPKEMTLKMLRDRLGRQKRANEKKVKTPLVRVK